MQDFLFKSRLRAIVNGYLDTYPQEAPRLAGLLDEVDGPADLRDRKRSPGHITASGLVLRPGHLLMVFHPVLAKWLQPGGHVESGEMPLEAAVREVLEETGVACQPHPANAAGGVPIDIDVHRIPAHPGKGEPEHWHYDFRYLLLPQKAGAASEDLRTSWMPLDDIVEASLEPAIGKLKAQA